MITGTINHDGTIGPVSEIIAKAGAAKQRGASLFLVPLLQSRDVVYETREHCENFGPTKVCTVEQLPKRIDVTNQTGIETIEVGSVKEALNYFLE
jgi:predicted S18 family serine protease